MIIGTQFLFRFVFSLHVPSDVNIQEKIIIKNKFQRVISCMKIRLHSRAAVKIKGTNG